MLVAGAVVASLAALALAACGGGDSTASPGPSKDTKPQGPTVDASTNRLGEILVDTNGLTLYLFAQDKGTKSTCFGSCARAWPPLRTEGEPTAGGDAKASRLGTTKRPDGPPQVTYNGHPLYLYQGDLKPGEATGQGVDVWGGIWYAVSPAGKKVTKGVPKGGRKGY
jgi:predicted lipoprotein with Yx(FWY)xxD motif